MSSGITILFSTISVIRRNDQEVGSGGQEPGKSARRDTQERERERERDKTPFIKIDPDCPISRVPNLQSNPIKVSVAWLPHYVILAVNMTIYVTLNPRFKVGNRCYTITMLQAFNHISGKQIKRLIQGSQAYKRAKWDGLIDSIIYC